MNNEVIKIMIKTVATTVDLLIGIALIVSDKQNNYKMRTAYLLFCLVNLAGIWC